MFDLTQTLAPDIPRFPGDPEVRIEPRRESPPWQVSSLSLGTHSGTHMDAPRHCLPGAPGIGAFGPERLVGRGLLIDATGYGENEPIPATVLDAQRGRTWPGWFALIRTGWDQHWSEDRYFRHPYLSRELAKALQALEAGLVAIDALSVDSTVNDGSEAHLALLGANILIAENLRGLGQIDPHSSTACAFLPLALGDADGAPARVVAWDAEPFPR